jgi:hypothetical protein
MHGVHQCHTVITLTVFWSNHQQRQNAWMDPIPDICPPNISIVLACQTRPSAELARVFYVDLKKK